MKAIVNGCFFSVKFSLSEVEEFASHWPCSNLPAKSVWIQFSKVNGDLVDLQPNLEELGADRSAVLALIQVAQNYAAKKLVLPDICFRH